MFPCFWQGDSPDEFKAKVDSILKNVANRVSYATDGSQYDSCNISAIYDPVALNVFKRFEGDYLGLIKRNKILSRLMSTKQLETLVRNVTECISQSTGTVILTGEGLNIQPETRTDLQNKLIGRLCRKEKDIIPSNCIAITTQATFTGHANTTIKNTMTNIFL
jgi:hypothetical protein